MRELYGDLMCWLARAGKLSKVCWQETYEIRERLDWVDQGRDAKKNLDIALCKIIEVASKTARARHERLPDSLHNMMILNSGGVKPDLGDHVEWWSERMREDSVRYIRAYVKMVGE